jgi:hypothetical protein
MEHVRSIDSQQSKRGESSTVRTQLIEAQILDCQFIGDDCGLEDLLAAAHSSNSDESDGKYRMNSPSS